MNFLPGEPLPPGFEDDEVSRTAIILKQIDSYNSAPLLGTEYAVELQEAGQLRPDYFCVLCQTCNDSRSIFVHWTSQVHRSKYLQTHFQKAHEVLQKLKRTPNSAPILVQATGLLVQLIENHFGRSRQLLTVSGDEFRRFRAKICSQVRDYFHFDECAGPDFVDEAQRVIQDLKPDDGIKINLKMTEADLKGVDGSVIALDAISSDDENFGTTSTPDGGKKPLRKKTLAEDQSANGRGANRSPPPLGVAVKPQSLPTPKELSIQASHIAQERYKWEKFRCMLELQLKALRDETETYETNPEKHPDYPDEWKQFWNRRYKQLQEEKKCDPNLYDYKPEWISYWKDRRIELFNIAVNKIKKDLKEKFKLGDEDEEKTKELMEAYKIRVASPREASAPAKAAIRRKPNFRSNNRPSNAGGGPGPETVIDISDDEISNPPSRNRSAAPYRRSHSRSLSPKRGAAGRRPVRRSRSRSNRRTFRSRGTRSRSSSRGPRRRSRSPAYYHRQQRDRYSGRPSSRDRASSTHSRDYGERRSMERERSSEYYRSGSYVRPSRYERVETFRVMDSRLYPEYSHSVPKGRSISPAASASNSKHNAKEEAPEPVEEGPLTVVSVLRMLSAVEEHLGSLGPKALNLLSKALAMEMVQPNAADDLLLNDDNCVFLETTKEKLKGILIAEVLDDPQKVRVVKKVITNIAAIIFQVTSRGVTESIEAQLKANANPAPIQLPFERNLVAPKLANALVLKGYYDVSTEDMNKLLHLFTLMVKTDHQRRQADKNNGLSFGEACSKLGLKNLAVAPDPESIGIDLDELMKEVENQLHKESIDAASGSGLGPGAGAGKPNEPGSGASAMESLTDSDLQTLLQNFKFLSNEEQVHLIGHLRKLEVMEPARVQRLRKYVNLAELSDDGESCSDFLSRVVNKSSSIGGGMSKPVEKSAMGQAIATVTGQGSTSKAALGGNSTMEALSSLTSRRVSSERDLNNLPINKQRRMRNSPSFMIDDDDDDEDDDYNFDDLVMKACDSNGGGKKVGAGVGAPSVIPVESSPNALTFKPAAASPKLSIKDTESIIADLMGTLSKGGGGGGGGGGSGPAGHRGNFLMNQQQQPAAVANPPNPNQMRGAGAYQNPGYPGIPAQQQQQQQPRQIMNNVSSGPDPNHQFPYGGAAGGYHPYAGNGVQHNYPGVAPGGHGGYGGGGGGGGGGAINPWANNGPPQPPFNQLPQNFLNQQQQPHPPHYNNMFGGRH